MEIRRKLGTADLPLFEQLLGALPDSPFFAKDAELRYVAANPAMARLCNRRTVGELLGRTARDMFPRTFAERYEALDRRILAGGRPCRDRLEFLPGNQWLLFSRYPIHDESGAVVGIAAMARQLPAPDRNHPTYRRLAAAVEHIRAHFDAPLDLAGLAACAGTSKSQLERDFVRLFGMTLRDFQHSQRIEHALQRLEGPDSIARIAQECGYADHSAFTRRFRAAVGSTPRAYRSGLSS